MRLDGARLQAYEGSRFRMVTMYTTTWCGHCLRLKTVLGSEGIPFREIDIEQNEAAADLVMTVNDGLQTVPTLVFSDGSALTNPSIGEVKAKLAG